MTSLYPEKSALHKRGTLTRRFLQCHCATRVISTSDIVPYSRFYRVKEGEWASDSSRPRLSRQTGRKDATSKAKMRAAKEKRSNKVRGLQGPQRKHTLICCSETSLGYWEY